MDRADRREGTEAVRAAGAPAPALDRIAAGASMGIGSLPHRDAAAGIEFGLREFEVVTLPSLPRRSPAEAMIAQGLVGVSGVSPGQYGSVVIDPDSVDPDAFVTLDPNGDSLVGLRAAMAAVVARGPTDIAVKWQFVGPVTLGMALVRAGLPVDLAFAVASSAVRQHTSALHAEIERTIPGCAQLVMFDEPWLVDLMAPTFPLAPDDAIDLLSGAMASLQPRATVGIHCCGPTDWSSVLAAGPQVLSLPATQHLLAQGGYLQRFMEQGGWIAWGAVATDGPVGVTSGRAWHHLVGLWCDLVQSGADPVLLRRQSMITPHCGLASHTPMTAERITRTVRDISRRVRDQATATRFVLGA